MCMHYRYFVYSQLASSSVVGWPISRLVAGKRPFPEWATSFLLSNVDGNVRPSAVSAIQPVLYLSLQFTTILTAQTNRIKILQFITCSKMCKSANNFKHVFTVPAYSARMCVLLRVTWMRWRMNVVACMHACDNSQLTQVRNPFQVLRIYALKWFYYGLLYVLASS